MCFSAATGVRSDLFSFLSPSPSPFGAISKHDEFLSVGFCLINRRDTALTIHMEGWSATRDNKLSIQVY